MLTIHITMKFGDLLSTKHSVRTFLAHLLLHYSNWLCMTALSLEDTSAQDCPRLLAA